MKASSPLAGVAAKMEVISLRRRVMRLDNPASVVESTTAGVSLVFTSDWILATSSSINVSMEARTCRLTSSVAPGSTYFAGSATM